MDEQACYDLKTQCTMLIKLKYSNIQVTQGRVVDSTGINNISRANVLHIQLAGHYNDFTRG